MGSSFAKDFIKLLVFMSFAIFYYVNVYLAQRGKGGGMILTIND